MKKIFMSLLIVVCALAAFGCGGRNDAFGVVDMNRVNTEAPIMKSTKEDLIKTVEKLNDEMKKETAGKSREEQQKIVTEKTNQLKLAQAEAQNKMKASLDSAIAQVSREKKLGAVLYKEVVPSGGVDITDDVLKLMQ